MKLSENVFAKVQELFATSPVRKLIVRDREMRSDLDEAVGRTQNDAVARVHGCDGGQRFRNSSKDSLSLSGFALYVVFIILSGKLYIKKKKIKNIIF